MTISIQVGSLAQQLGATSFVGAANGLGVIRQGAPLVVALLLAGAVGSAIASDLGARTIREEIDALEVLGLSAVRRLVAPRVAAVTVVAVLLCGVVAFAGLLTGFLFNLLAQGGSQDDAVDRALELIGPTGRYFTNALGNGPYAEVYGPYSIVPDGVLCQAKAVQGCR